MSSEKVPSCVLRVAALGCLLLAAACLDPVANAPEPLDGGTPFACGREGQPCCANSRCDYGSRCIPHASRPVATPAFEHVEILTAGLTGMARDDVLFGTCPLGARRVSQESTHVDAAGQPYCVSEWADATDPTNCAVRVHYGLKAYESIECRVVVRAMLPDPLDPPNRCAKGTVSPAPSICGNGWAEAGETCDDGDLASDTACDGSCRPPAFCGNRVVETTETCDDGNRSSGDGCSATCDLETCGNGLLDPGEVCEGGATCTSTCETAAACGDGVVTGAEQCDDGARISVDGCDASCVYEYGMVLTSLQLLDPDSHPNSACDFTADGRPDAVLNDALGLFGAFFGEATRPLFQVPPHSAVLLSGADDATLSSLDTTVRLATVSLDDTNGIPDDDLSGTAVLRFNSNARDDRGPWYSQACTLDGTALDCDGGTFRIPMVNGVLALLERAHLRGTLVPPAMTGLLDAPGRYLGLCGALPLRLLVGAPDVFGAFGQANPGLEVPLAPCDSSLPREDVWISDVLLAGAVRKDDGFYLITPVQPDVDLDGDGLEAMIVLPSTEICQGSVVACIDGDGSILLGHDCQRDVRFADGISVAGAVGVVPFRIAP